MAKKIRKSPSTEQSAAPGDTAAQEQVSIVGVGMSAGGLEACKKFLTAMPVDSGVVIVLVPHLDPTHESLMVTLLARQTKMPVCEAEDGMKVRPNNVYVIPPNKCLSIRNGVLQLSDPPAVHRFETAIDIFLISLARDQREHAIGIVLSGTGTSGSQGLKEIKQAGGMVIAQLPESAQFNQMPLSAIATGLMDSVLPPEEMPAEIIRYVQAPWLRRDLEDDGVTPIELNDILTLLQAQTKYQFHCYRRNMVRRRVQRRMGIRQIKEFADYLKYLRQNPEEMQLLCKDLLISVTAFFRDPAAFLDLETKVIPTLIQSQQLKITQQQSGIASDTLSRDTENTLRTWVPACATGEETYSIAMLLTERYTAEKLPCSFQLFATDLNENSLDFARQGIYPESALANISEDRLKQFFVRTGEHHFQVNKMLRGSVVFACHNLLADAPFSKLDLVVCRNLLIYLEPEVQQKVIALFHFSLRQDGYLMLGGSETIGRAVDLFEPVSKKSRIYHRTGPRRHDLLELPIAVSDKLKDTTSNPRASRRQPVGFVETLDQLQHELKATTDDLQSTIEELESSNEELRISHEEAMSANEELQSANEELESSKEELQSLNEELTTVNSQLQEKVHELDQANCDISNLMVSADIATLFLDEQLCIQRFTPPAARLLNLRDTDIGRAFREFAPTLDDESLPEDCRRVLRERSSIEKEVWSLDPSVVGTIESPAGQTDAKLARRCYLRRIVPYRSGNQSSQGVVITLLDITSRIESEAEARKLATVLRDSNDAVMVLDLNGQITTWNAGSAHLYGYTEAEALQLNILEIVPSEDQETMRAMLVQITRGRHVDSFESKRTTKDGRVLDVWLTVTALMDDRNRPAFAATTERDVTSRTQQGKDHAQLDALRSAEHYKSAEELRAILNATGDAVITINHEGIMVRINAAAERLFGYTSSELIQQNVSILMTSPDRENHDGYIQHYLETKEARIIGIGREVCCQRKDGSTFHGELSINEVDHLGLFTGMIRDISERRRLQNEILRAVSEEQRRIGQDLHDTAGQDLAGLAYLIKSHLTFLEDSTNKESSSDSSGSWMASELVTMRNTSDAIRDLQRKIRTVIRGLAPVDVSGDGLTTALMDLTVGIRELHHIHCEFHCATPILLNDNQLATHLYRIAQESINNGLRHGGASQISVTLEESPNWITLTIHDDGCGIKFTQSTEIGGFGLHIMRYRANLIGARFSIQPGDDGGTTVCCCLPRIEGGTE